VVLESPQVLIADNDRAVAGLLLEVTAALGCRVAVVHDGAAACELLQQQPVQVLVCDLDMPRRTGMEVIEWLRQQPVRPAVVVISGWLDAAATQRLQSWPHVAAVLRKPFDLRAYGDLVRGLLRTGGRAAGAS
jgi:CheY-like chemotaxis protein